MNPVTLNLVRNEDFLLYHFKVNPQKKEVLIGRIKCEYRSISQSHVPPQAKHDILFVLLDSIL